MSGRRERKVITVLFADLAGFTSRSETMDPEDVAALLDPYHASLKSELERFGGTVEKFIGDAVMAIFGAPVTHEDDAERAVRAGLAIRDWAAEEGIELRIGINTGEALVTIGARPDQGQTMAAGDVVNTAARLQSAAPLGGILIGAQTKAAIGSSIELGDEVAADAKGKAHPVQAQLVVRARARPQVERVHGATLVGRRRELDMLFGALGRSRQERAPELVTLVGVPGIGKSRLVLELYSRIEQELELTSWRSGRCLAYGDGITFWALGEIVKSEAGILEADGSEEAERKLHRIVDDPWIESHLRPLIGLDGVDGGGTGRREEAFTAWRQFFERLAEERPLVLVFEDLHWADDDLLDFIDHLIDWATGVPLLVVCTARPELLSRRPGWGGGKQNALTVSLSPLSDDDTSELLAELLANDLIPTGQHTELLTRAGGNPLYAEEFVRMVRARGSIERLPETVQGLIAARLDLLDTEQKTIVQDAAVVGKTFWTSTLTALADLDGAVIEQRLHTLERKEFVRRERTSSMTGDAEYAFRHVLVRDVAYGQIPRAERVAKHLVTAGWIEQQGRPDDYSEMLAHHYLQALELGAATGADVDAFAASAQHALSVAGDHALALNAYAPAVRYYRGAIELLDEDDVRCNRLLLQLGYCLWLIGEPSTEILQRAADRLGAAGDPEGAGEAEIRLAEHSWLDGDRNVAFDHLGRALALLDPLPPSTVKARAIGTSSRFRMLASDDEEAVRVGLEALAMATELGLGEVQAATLNNIGSSRYALGDSNGLADIAEAVSVASVANAPFELCRATGNLAALLWADGKLAEAMESWEDTRTVATRYGQVSFQRWVSGAILVPYYALGRWREAAEGAEAFIAELEAGRPHYLASQAYTTRALLRFARGDDHGASADLALALTTGRRAGDNQAVLPTLARVAHVRLELGDRAAATDASSEFLEALRAGGVGFASSSVHELAWTLTALGRGQELAEALSDREDPWSHAAAAYGLGDARTAANVMNAIGASAEEAYARLTAGRQLAEQGRDVEAGEELDRADVFYRGVEATRYLQVLDELRAALT